MGKEVDNHYRHRTDRYIVDPLEEERLAEDAILLDNNERGFQDWYLNRYYVNFPGYLKYWGLPYNDMSLLIFELLGKIEPERWVALASWYSDHWR